MADFTAITTQEEFDNKIQERLARQKETLEKEIGERFEKKYADYDKLKEVANNSQKLSDELQELTKQNQSYEEQVKGLNQAVTSYETEKLKAEVALKQGLPYELASRLVGSDENEIKQDAERLSALLKTSKPIAPGKSIEPTIKTDSVDAALQQMVTNLNNQGE